MHAIINDVPPSEVGLMTEAQERNLPAVTRRYIHICAEIKYECEEGALRGYKYMHTSGGRLESQHGTGQNIGGRRCVRRGWYT
jgi:hypothetical protein